MSWVTDIIAGTVCSIGDGGDDLDLDGVSRLIILLYELEHPRSTFDASKESFLMSLFWFQLAAM